MIPIRNIKANILQKILAKQIQQYILIITTLPSAVISLAKWSYCAVTVHVLETQAQRLCLMQELGQKERPWDRGSPMLRAGPARCLLGQTLKPGDHSCLRDL